MISNRKRPNHIHISKDNPYYRMSYKGYISEATLNMAKHLDRCLGSDEYIYFIDGNSFNSGIDNLQLVSHKEFTKLNQINRLDRRIEQLNELGRCTEHLTSHKKVLESQLKEIRHRHTPCNCRSCMRSIDARLASYRIRSKDDFSPSTRDGCSVHTPGSKLRFLHIEPCQDNPSGYKILGVFPYPQSKSDNG